jgi:hypothetical protein
MTDILATEEAGIGEHCGCSVHEDRMASRALERLVVQECDRIRRQAIRVEGSEANQGFCNPAELVALKRIGHDDDPAVGSV